MARFITSISCNSEHELATAMALKKFLGISVQKAIQIAKRTHTECVPPIPYNRDLSTDTLLEELNEFEITIIITNQ